MTLRASLFLGDLCPQGHDYEGTGKSARYKSTKTCAACVADNRRASAARKRGGDAAPSTPRRPRKADKTMAPCVHAIPRTHDPRVLGLLAEFCGAMTLQDFASRLGVDTVRVIELVMLGLGDDPPAEASRSPAASGPTAGDVITRGPSVRELVDEDLDEPRAPPRWRARILAAELEQVDVDEEAVESSAETEPPVAPLGPKCKRCGGPVPAKVPTDPGPQARYCSADCRPCGQPNNPKAHRRALVEQTHKTPKVDVAIGRLLWPERPQRPRTRAECRDAVRPCPWVGCKHHLYLDVNDGGNLRFTRPGVEVWDMPESCSLDVAEYGGETLERVGELMGYTRERCRQVEVAAIAKVPGDARAEFLEAVLEQRAMLGDRIDWLAEAWSS